MKSLLDSLLFHKIHIILKKSNLTGAHLKWFLRLFQKLLCFTKIIDMRVYIMNERRNLLFIKIEIQLKGSICYFKLIH